jgi:cytochrome c peroxidase
MPLSSEPGRADLGVWNVYANPDFPKPQAALNQILCGPTGPVAGECAPQAVLPHTIGMFKTPSVRDLGQSEPYFHSGEVDTVEEAIELYLTTSDLARAGALRSGSPEMAKVRIEKDDVAPLAAFLRSLNEDYH